MYNVLRGKLVSLRNITYTKYYKQRYKVSLMFTMYVHETVCSLTNIKFNIQKMAFIHVNTLLIEKKTTK